MGVNIIIPVYNEKGSIAKVLTDWSKIISRIPDSSILLIDDGSQDGTAEIIDTFSLRNPAIKVIHKKNGGHGSAILTGYRESLKSGSEWTFQLDSDDQIPAEEFWKLWEKRELSTFILANRKDRHDPLHRLVIWFFHRVLVFLLFGIWISDPNVPFRLMKNSSLRRYSKILKFDPFAPNLFLSILARHDGVQTLDVPVHHKVRETGASVLNPRKLLFVCLRCVKEIFQLRAELV